MEQYFEKALRATAFPRIQGTLIAAEPRDDETVLVLAVSDRAVLAVSGWSLRAGAPRSRL